MKQMNSNKKTRLVAALLVICVLVQTYINVPSVRAEEAVLTAEKHGYVSINGINIEHTATLSDNKDGSFQLDVELFSTYTDTELNQSSVSAANGTYPVTHSGWYLVELWGGEGADVAGAGVGGSAGYVYAKMYLEAGQTLFYSLGGNGTLTEKSHTGGGANGTGGGHGMVGGYAIGGGGGYSAVYLYDNGELTDHNKTSISEADRISKYVMIAGGGGGGGAAPGSGTVVGTADGGAGGSIFGASGTVSGDNVVSGTYFSGANGKSAGMSTAYIGKGGTYEPGATSDTVLGLTDAKAVLPDDWYGSVGGKGGAGGTGELRGGGGGAGYAGGSGGLMTSVLISSNVGGGGGGSSFIASDVNEKTVSYSGLSEEESAYLISDNPSSTGGAVSITYLIDENESKAFLENISIEWCLSPYITFKTGSFIIEDYSANSSVTFNWERHNDETNHEKITLSDISLLDTSGSAGGGFHLSFSFFHSTGFMGGNNVPIFRNGAGEGYDCPLTLRATTTDGEKTAVLDLGEDCGYVNLPLLLEVHAHDLESNSAGSPFTADKMFYDHYADVRGNLDTFTYEYDGIEEIGLYHIYDAGGTEILNGDEQEASLVTVTPNATANYSVVLPVKIKTPVTYAKVGTPIVPDADGYVYLRDMCTITVPGSRTDQLGKFMVTHTKSLTAQTVNGETVYDYTIQLSSQTTQEHNITTDTPGVNHTPAFDTTSTVEYEHTIEVTGWYLLQLWGGDGGAGGNSITGSGSGGAGGKGGYVSGYVHLEKGDIVNIFMGVNGEDKSGSWNTLGGAGKHSRASLLSPNESGGYDETVLMIAGGGGGGGKYYFAQGKAGDSVVSSYSDATPDSSNEYAAYDGKTGRNTTGGAAGSNYINTGVVRPLSWADDDTIAANFTADGLSEELQASFETLKDESTAGGTYNANNSGGGTVHVECYEITDDGSAEVVQDLLKTLVDYSLSATVTKYFEIVGVIFDEEKMDSQYAAPTVTFTNVLGSDTALTVDGIYPIVRQNTSGTTHTASTEFSITVRLTPAEGFKGGNDVPLFVDGVTLLHEQYEKDGQTGVTTAISPKPEIVLGANDAADYANVVIDYDALPVLEAQKLFYQTGAEGYAVSDLYEVVSGVAPTTVDPNSETAWRYDYVNVLNTVWDNVNNVEVASDEILTPTHTTEYTITMGVEPKNGSVKAAVVDPQVAHTVSETAIIIVGHEVTFALDGLSHDMTDLHGKYVVEQGDDLVFTLTPLDTENHEIPHTITVSVDGVPLERSQYAYDLVSGEVTVNASLITGNVHVEATAKGKDYAIYFVYGDTPDATTFTTVEEIYEAGSSIENAFHTKTASHPNAEGYDFSWDWGEGVDVAPTVMPTNDLWVIGTFTPHKYTVTVHYIYEDKSTAFADHVETVTYGASYAVSVPTLKGYLPYVGEDVTTTVQGTMGAADVEVTVEYRLTEDTLTVIYRNQNGEQIGEAETHTVRGDTYGDIAIATLEGYTQSDDGITPDPTWTTISGSISDGNIVVVYYIPNTYTVTFTVDGATFETREVVFDGMYGYLSDGNYQAFGYPAKDHHTFEGWYLDGAQITEETLVKTAADHTVEAKMTEDTFTVTVKYQFEDGTQAFPDAGGSFNYGDSYAYTSPELSDFTPDIAEVTGTVLGHNLVIIVTYTRNNAGEAQIAVRVDWGTLRYSFVPGVWDPETHTYKDPMYTPAAEGQNTVTVTNEGSYTYVDSVKTPLQIVASYSYTPNPGYEDISAYYTEGDDDQSDRINHTNVSVGESKTVYVWMEGNFEPNATGEYGVGTCTVTIK